MTTRRSAAALPAAPIVVVAVAAALAAASCTAGDPSPAPSPVLTAGPSGVEVEPSPPALPTGPYDQFDDDTIPGITTATCIPGGSTDLMRFGDFLVGGFATYDLGRDPRRPGSSALFVTPRPPVDSAPPLTITATGPHGRRAVFRTDVLSAADSTGTPFYVIGAAVPAAGAWTFRLVAGTRRGCFGLVVR